MGNVCKNMTSNKGVFFPTVIWESVGMGDCQFVKKRSWCKQVENHWCKTFASDEFAPPINVLPPSGQRSRRFSASQRQWCHLGGFAETVSVHLVHSRLCKAQFYASRIVCCFLYDLLYQLLHYITLHIITPKMSAIQRKKHYNWILTQRIGDLLWAPLALRTRG